MGQQNQDSCISNVNCTQLPLFFSICVNSLWVFYYNARKYLLISFCLRLTSVTWCYSIETNKKIKHKMLNFIRCLPKLNSYACPALKYQSMSGILRKEVRKESGNCFFLIYNFMLWSKASLKVTFQYSIYSVWFGVFYLIWILATLNSFSESTFYPIRQELLAVTNQPCLTIWKKTQNQKKPLKL